ncbi:hypothetical protein [Burkholderia cenocepacia]|uniref:hypothetical protein n=1 Tax=Burkholderia cenocepacia TaxID=95486 RepID=UPI00114C9232|nr:hypothetical protein [Burkholderia cenocepacia]
MGNITEYVFNNPTPDQPIKNGEGLGQHKYCSLSNVNGTGGGNPFGAHVAYYSNQAGESEWWFVVENGILFASAVCLD